MKEKLLKIIKVIFRIVKIVVVASIIISLTKCIYNHIKVKRLIDSRTKMIKYFSENIDKYKDELKAMGYRPSVMLDLNDKLEIFTINNGSQMKVFIFDSGLDRINYHMENDVSVSVSKSTYDSYRNPKIPLYYDDDDYSIEVRLSAPEYSGEYQHSPFNDYKTNFEEYLVIWFGEQKDDYRIKKYISAQELRELVKEGKKLEDELMKLYETRKKR